jgi:hypothetical protein
LCKLEKKEILPDDGSCEKYEAVPKCKFCTNYRTEKDFLGSCMGTALAYPDMIAAKCADFQWISQN